MTGGICLRYQINKIKPNEPKCRYAEEKTLLAKITYYNVNTLKLRLKKWKLIAAAIARLSLLESKD